MFVLSCFQTVNQSIRQLDSQMIRFPGLPSVSMGVNFVAWTSVKTLLLTNRSTARSGKEFAFSSEKGKKEPPQ
jgi:hypothetical protein